MKKIVWLIVLPLLFSACGPSPEQVQIAIAETLTAQPTYTFTFLPSPTLTGTPTPTATITPTLTTVPTDTPTPTPTPDIRIIDVDPQKFLLKASELPEEGKYYLPGSDWMSINTNEEIISLRGVEEGRDYVIRTGRVTGWWVEYLRGTRAVEMPEDVYVFVAQYKTAEGAQLALLKYNNVETNTKYRWRYETVDRGLGDKYIVTVYDKITSGGDKDVSYLFEFTYRNYLVEIGLFDLEKYISHDFALLLGEKVLNKLEAAELVFPPTATPKP